MPKNRGALPEGEKGEMFVFSLAFTVFSKLPNHSHKHIQGCIFGKRDSTPSSKVSILSYMQSVLQNGCCFESQSQTRCKLGKGIAASTEKHMPFFSFFTTPDLAHWILLLQQWLQRELCKGSFCNSWKGIIPYCTNRNQSSTNRSNVNWYNNYSRLHFEKNWLSF